MYDTFTQQYKLNKTLRFELRPVYGGVDYIENFKSEFLKEVVARDEL